MGRKRPPGEIRRHPPARNPTPSPPPEPPRRGYRPKQDTTSSARALPVIREGAKRAPRGPQEAPKRRPRGVQTRRLWGTLKKRRFLQQICLVRRETFQDKEREAPFHVQVCHPWAILGRLRINHPGVIMGLPWSILGLSWGLQGPSWPVPTPSST